jgi:hypothetical protein
MIPKFDAYYTNLHSSFLVFEKYLDFLKNEFLNGFVLIEGNNKKAYMFMFEGEIQTCLCTAKKGYKKISPIECSSYLTDDSFISTYRCLHEQVDFFSKAYTAKLVYNKLSSDIINPVKLMNRCRSDNFTGYIEANDGGSPRNSYIYFYNGDVLGTMNLTSKDGVFENSLGNSAIQNKILNTSINLYKLSPEVRDPEEDRKLVIKCFQEIFNMLEAEGQSRDFSSVWRKCALELSDNFVFLDPFAGEFNYKNNTIDLWEKIHIKTAAHGMDALVRLIAKKTAVPDSRIMAIKNNYLTILADYEIRN